MKKALASSEVPTEKVTTTEKTKKYWEFKVPRLNIQSSATNGYLILTVVVFAFFLGMLTNKVMYLETAAKAATTNNTAAVAADTQAAVPTTAAKPVGPVNVSNGNFPIKGDANAKVTVVEFADFRCPFCEQWFTAIEPNLIKDYVDTGKVKFAFRNYAFLGPASTVAANAGECANEQNKFWEFHDYMYQNQPDESDTSMFTPDKLTTIASNLGMDGTAFQSCLSANKYDKNVSQDLADGQKAGVDGTPTTFINGIGIVGAVPYDQIKQEIDKALAAK